MADAIIGFLVGIVVGVVAWLVSAFFHLGLSILRALLLFGIGGLMIGGIASIVISRLVVEPDLAMEDGGILGVALWVASAMQERVSNLLSIGSRVATDRRTQVTTVTAVGGAAVAGTGGATVGLLLGGTVGAAVGIVPAVFTLGLSIPLMSAIGGGCGTVIGGITGGTVGLTGGGFAGYGFYTKRSEVLAAIGGMQARLGEVCRTTTNVAFYFVAVAREGGFMGLLAARARGEKLAEAAAATKTKVVEVASDKVVQVTAASAAGGAVVGGVGGGAAGLATGSTLGAVVGIVPAIFTFGLSIPVFAAIGGGCGLAAGTAMGGTTGAVVGGTCGYGIFSRRGATGGKIEHAKEAACKQSGQDHSRRCSTTGGTLE